MNKEAIKKILLRPFHNIPLQEKINFTRNLSIAIKSGSSLMQGLELIKDQSSSKFFKRVLSDVIKNINNGQFLAQSLNRYRLVFGDFFINIIKVGETTGNLSTNLLYLSEELKKQKEVRKKVRAALFYPIIILVMTLIITSFLIFFVFPKFLPILTSMNVELPWPTLVLIGIVEFLKSYGVFALGGSILLGFTFRSLLYVKKVRYIFDRVILLVPILSRIVKNLNIASFTRALGLLLKSGMPIVESLEVTSGTIANTYYGGKLKQMIEEVKEGGSVAHYMAKHEKLFPSMLTNIIKVGEQTGNLEENLFYLSGYYGEEVDDTLGNLTVVIEPLLLVVMGLMVGFVAISIIIPIYSISQQGNF